MAPSQPKLIAFGVEDAVCSGTVRPVDVPLATIDPTKVAFPVSRDVPSTERLVLTSTLPLA